MRASCPVFMFCAPGPVFDSTDGIGSSFNVLRSRTHLRRYGGRWVQFLAVPTASGPIFMFCASGLIFGGTEGIVSNHEKIK
jgi:hypothetical protein